jgi:cellobiose phosphorylase
MGTGDWNDGMNRSAKGRGESVWLGFFRTRRCSRRFAEVARDCPAR